MPAATDAVTLEVRIEARPETIWPFLVDPVQLVRWMGTAATLDPRPGGVFDVQVTPAHRARGEFLEVVPYERVAFSWGWDGSDEVPPGASQVSIALVPDDGATLVRLTHSGLAVEQQEKHRHGWSHFVERLAAVGGGDDPGPDPWARPSDLAG